MRYMQQLFSEFVCLSAYIQVHHIRPGTLTPASAFEQNSDFDVFVPKRLEDSIGFVRMLRRCVCYKCNELHM